MIATIADLLKGIIDKGIVENDESPSHHPTIVGNMYEGLTRNVVGRSLLEFDLKVAEGQIRNANGQLSPQIDCMLGVGDGAQIPNTTQFIYDIDKVVAVFEVKKALDKTKLADAIRMLKDTADLKLHIAPSASPTAEELNIDRANYAMLHDAFRAVARKPYPLGEIATTLNRVEMEVLWSVLVDVDLPLRIIWGFGGYKTERALRNAFLECVPDGRPHFKYVPNLVLCGDFSLVKVNGMPFVADWSSEGRDIVYSQRGLGIRNLLSVLWYRLSKIFRKDFLWLTDGKAFSHTPLLRYRVSDETITRIGLKKGSALVPERQIPSRLLCISLEEAVLIRRLFSQPSINVTSEAFLPELQSDCELAHKALAELPEAPLVRSLDWKTGEELHSHLLASEFLAREGDLLRLTTSRAIVMLRADPETHVAC